MFAGSRGLATVEGIVVAYHVASMCPAIFLHPFAPLQLAWARAPLVAPRLLQRPPRLGSPPGGPPDSNPVSKGEAVLAATPLGGDKQGPTWRALKAHGGLDV